MRQTLGPMSCGVLILLLSSTTVRAQAVSTAQINGTLRDPSGLALPGVTITVTQTATGVTRTTTTDSTGSYILTNLPIGPYQFEAMLQGFRTYKQTGIALEVNSNPTLAVTLEIGQVEETVSVQGGAALVETRNPGIGQVITNQQVLELPLNGRQLTQLIFSAGLATGGADTTSAPGAAPLNSGVRNYPTVTISVAGGLSNGMSYLLDGGTHNDPFNNLNLPLPFPDALQEFRVETSALPARYGHHSAAAVNAVTKSGTNSLHGDVFEFRRDHSLNATNAFEAIGPDGRRRDDGLRRDQFGGTLGGPVVQGKLFYFAGYQGTLVDVTPTSTFAFVPTPAMLAGDFTAVTSPACNGGRAITLKSPFVNNTIARTQFSPAALNLTARLPPATDPCGKVFFDRKKQTAEHIFLGRLDYQWSNSHSIFGRYQLADYTSQPDNDPSNVLAYANAPIHDKIASFVLGDTYLLGPNTVSSFRLTFNNSDVRKSYVGFFDLAAIGVGPIATPVPNFMRTAVSGAFTLGAASASASATPTKTLQLAEDVSLVRRSHQIGAGINFIHSSLDAESLINAPGNFSFTGVNTGLGLADFLIGRPASFSQGMRYTLKEQSNYVGLYVQDAWRVTSRLTVNAGLRWDPYLPFTGDEGQFNHFSLDQFRGGVRSTVFHNAPIGLIFQGDPGYPGNAVGEKGLADLAPRLAGVWDPRGDGLMTVRAAYGRFFDLPHLYNFLGFALGPPFGAVTSVTNGTFDNPWGNTPGGNPFPIARSPDMPFPQFGGYLTFPLDMKPPYSDQWNVSVQRQVGTAWMVSANYISSRGHRLPIGDQLNPAVFMPGATIANTNQRRVLSLENAAQGRFYGSIIGVDPSGTSTYDGLLLSAQHRSAGGLFVSGNWTWSKCITDVVNYEPAQAGIPLVKPGDPKYDRGSCGSTDQRHIVNLSTVYQVPHLPNGPIGIITSDWQVSAIVTAQSGTHFAVTTGVDNALSGQPNQRPNQVLDDVYMKKGYQWLNPAAFQAPAPGTYGSLGNNTIVGPGRFNVDLGLTRSIRIGGERQIQFRAEAFNVLNQLHLNNPTSTLSDPNFGFITSAGDPRIVQLALKYLF